MASPLFAVVGPRSAPPGSAEVIAAVVRSARAQGFEIAVTDARGVSAVARAASPSARLFSAAFRGPGALPARAAALVRACAAVPGSAVVGFVSCPCPAGVVPARSWRAGSPPSGSWSELALAVGLGVPVAVTVARPGPASRRSPFGELPAWPGGRWVWAGRGFSVPWFRWVPAQGPLL